MKGKRIGAGLAVALLALAGCSTTGTQVSTTRFHLGQPIARGQIAVEPLDPALRNSPEFQTYAGIIGAQLARLGFTESPGLANSEQVAAVAVEFGARAGPSRGGLTLGLGLGGGSFGRRSASFGGVGAAVPVSGGRGREIASTRLIVQIKRRSDATTVWEGRAETEARAGTPAAQPADAVQRLASALFADFPGVSGRTVVVK